MLYCATNTLATSTLNSNMCFTDILTKLFQRWDSPNVKTALTYHNHCVDKQCT